MRDERSVIRRMRIRSPAAEREPANWSPRGQLGHMTGGDPRPPARRFGKGPKVRRSAACEETHRREGYRRAHSHHRQHGHWSVRSCYRNCCDISRRRRGGRRPRLRWPDTQRWAPESAQIARSGRSAKTVAHAAASFTPLGTNYPEAHVVATSTGGRSNLPSALWPPGINGPLLLMRFAPFDQSDFRLQAQFLPLTRRWAIRRSA
jgi:hypothetical protein